MMSRQKQQKKTRDNTFAACRWNADCSKLLSPFLADRTNSRAYATVLRLSVVWRMYCA